MSKGKKSAGKSQPSAADGNWEKLLADDTLYKDDWKPYIVFIEGEGRPSEEHLDALMPVVEKGYRRKFGCIVKSQLLVSAKNDLQKSQAAAPSGGKKSKQAAAPSALLPHIAACEQAVTASEEGTLTDSLLAKLLKYKMIRMRDAEIEKRNAKAAGVVDKGNVKGDDAKGKKGKSAGKAKGKTTPAVDTEASVPVPSLPPTEMKKRGEEGDGPPPINDEPKDGPDYYILVTGFSSIEILSELKQLGIKADALIKVKNPDPDQVEAERQAKKSLSPHRGAATELQTEDEEELRKKREAEEARQQQLNEFWKFVEPLVESTESGSMLRDMAQVDISPPKALVPERTDEKEAYGLEFFEKVALLLYELLETFKQYKRYIQYVDFIDLTPPTPGPQELFLTPTPSTTVLPQASTPSVQPGVKPASSTSVLKEKSPTETYSHRYYDELLREVPQECVSVPLILYSMVEQVSVNLSETNPLAYKDEVRSVVDTSVFTNFVTQLALPDDQKEKLIIEDNDGEPCEDLAPLGRSIPPVNEQGPTVLPYSDESARRLYHLKNGKLLDVAAAESHMRKLSFNNRVLHLPQLGEQLAKQIDSQIHALQHLASENISQQLMKTQLVQLAFEQMVLTSASTDNSDLVIKEDNQLIQSSLKVDWPFSISLTSPTDSGPEGPDSQTALVKRENQTDRLVKGSPEDSDTTDIPLLQLPSSVYSLDDFCVLERLKKDHVLQLLAQEGQIRPYLDVYYHKATKSLLLASHSGFNSNLREQCLWERQVHSQVGFNNYIRHCTAKYGDMVDDVWFKDEERKAKELSEWQQMVEEKIKQYKEQAAADVAEEESKQKSAKGGKKTSQKKDTGGKTSAKGKTSATGKKQKDAVDETETVTATSLGLGEFEFNPSRAFSGYSIGDKVLLLKSTVSTAYSPDGHQIRVFSSDPVDARPRRHFSVVGPDIGMSVSLQLTDKKEEMIAALKERKTKPTTTGSLAPVQETEGGDGKTEDECEQGDRLSSEGPTLPSGVQSVLFSAQMGDYIHISTNHFGPNGDRSLPLPPKPELPPAQIEDSSSRPGSRKASATPKKMSKKDQEAQQAQLLEQQKQLEQQRREEEERLTALWREKVEKIKAENQVQQLNVSTAAGLHIHCRVVPSPQGGDTPLLSIHQMYPIKTAGSQSCEKNRLLTLKETSRTLYSDGTLNKVLENGSFEILSPEGVIYRSANDKERDMFVSLCSNDKERPVTGGSQQKSENEDEGMPRSTSRVTFSGIPGGEGDRPVDSANQLGVKEDSYSEDIWIIILPSGERYAWKKCSANGTGKKPLVKETIKEEATGQQELNENGKQEDQEEEKNDEKKELFLPLKSLEISSSKDPVTNEEMITREDKVIFVKRPNGQFVVDYPDGTRFTTQSKKDTAALESFTVECMGYAKTVYNSSDKMVQVFLPHDVTISCSLTGDYTVEKAGGDCLSFSSKGTATYQPALNKCQYVVDYSLSQENVITCVKSAKPVITADLDGQISPNSVALDGSATHHLPSLYILAADGTCCRLTSMSELKRLMGVAQSHPKGMVLEDTLPGEPLQKNITVFDVDNSSDPCYHVLPYNEENIIPPSLRNLAYPSSTSTANRSRTDGSKKPRFGVNVGKGLMIGSLKRPSPPGPMPVVKALLHRHFVVPQDHPKAVQSAAREALARYVEWRSKEEQSLKDLLPKDLRSDEEKAEATKQHTEAMEMAEEQEVLETDSELWTGYVQRLKGIDNASLASVALEKQTEMSESVQQKIAEKKRENQETEAAKNVLISGKIPPYFESDSGRAFLAAQAADLQRLTQKLAQPRSQQPYKVKVSFEDPHHAIPAPPSGGSTPSTTCSTAVPMGENTSSPSPTELGQMSSPSAIRAQNPTPFHADGQGTPTQARPLNPTPGHAFRPDALIQNGNASSPQSAPEIGSFSNNNGQNSLLPATYNQARQILVSEDLQFEAESPIADTIVMLDQEGTVVESDVNMETKDLDDVDPPKRFNRSTYFTVTGEQRRNEIMIPQSLMGSKPGEVPNKQFMEVEEPVRRKVMTSSIAKPLSLGEKTMTEMRGFELYPTEVVFGVLKEGCCYGYTVTIRNVGIDSCRYKVRPPPPSTGLKVRYTPGPIAAGMKSTFDIEIYAMAVGVIGESGVGAVRHILEIITETSILHLPITAIILTQSAYEKRQAIHPQGKQGPEVKLLSGRPSSRERINRPSREDQH